MRSLVIGYGNASRRDDGVGLHLINALRIRWGQEALADSADGWDELGGGHDTLFLQQLSPELAATLAEYERVIFVDAALPDLPEALRVEPVAPSYRLGAISHHLEPATLLALTGQLYGRAPEAYLVSVRGHDFDFGDQLSAATAAALSEAVERVLALTAA